MWTCSYCNETSDDDSWEVCWKCNTPRSVTPAAAEELKEQNDQLQKQFQSCLRCGSRMQYAGARKFHEGARWGVLGDLGELFVNKEAYETYICQRCGKIEFYVEGVGNELRGDPTEETSQDEDATELRLESFGSDNEHISEMGSPIRDMSVPGMLPENPKPQQGPDPAAAI